MNSNVHQSPQIIQRGLNIKGMVRDSTIVTTQVVSKDTMDSIKAQIAAVRNNYTQVASVLELASVTGGPLDKVTDTSTLRRITACAVILDQEVRPLTEAGISHFQLILKQSLTTVEKIARVLTPNINHNGVLFLEELLEKITEVTDGALLNVLFLHLKVMIAVVRLTTGGKHVTYYKDSLQDLVEEANKASRELVRKPSHLWFSQLRRPPSPSSSLISTLPSGLLSPPSPSYSNSVTPGIKGAVDARSQDVQSSKKIHEWKFPFLFCGTFKKEDCVVSTIPRPSFHENLVKSHVATLGAEPTFARSGYHIIILTCKDTLEWMETSNGPTSE